MHAPQLLLAASVVAVTSECSSTPAPARLQTGEVEIAGIVRENVRGCVVDGPCLLRVETPAGMVTVLYGAPRGTGCKNEAAAKHAATMAPGDAVRIRGTSNGGANVSVCDADRDFVTPLHPEE
jgi:hypothetical protein